MSPVEVATAALKWPVWQNQLPELILPKKPFLSQKNSIKKIIWNSKYCPANAWMNSPHQYDVVVSFETIEHLV